MAQQIINIGSSPNKGDGDPIRIAMDKINDNFTELYARDVNTDAQTLTLVGDTISISGGNSVTITHPTIPTTTSELTNDSGFITSGLQAGDAFDVKGSVFADDSTLLVDSVNGKIVGDVVANTVTTPNLVLDGDVTTLNELFIDGGAQAIGIKSQVNIVMDGDVIFQNGTITGLDYSSIANTPTALSDFTNDLDYAPIVATQIQTNGLPSGTEVTDGIFAKQGLALNIGYKDLAGQTTAIFVDETTGVQFFKDVVFDNVTVDFTTSAIVNTPFAETANLATVATSGDYDDLTNKPTDLVRTTMTGAIDANSFSIDNLFAIQLQTQTSAVTGSEGVVVIADGVGWDPLGNGRKSMVVYLGGAWREIAAVPGV